MSAQNQISVVIPQAVIDTVTTKLKECKTALAPYLQALTVEQRQDFLKWATKPLQRFKKLSLM